MKIVLYSTHCPQCQVIEKKLKAANLTFEVIDDTAIMRERGMTQLPMLQIDDNEPMSFKEANKWIKETTNG